MIFTFLYIHQSNIKAVDQSIEEEEIRAQSFLTELNGELDQRKSIQATAEWKYATNITDANEKRKDEIGAENAEFYKVCTLKRYFI